MRKLGVIAGLISSSARSGRHSRAGRSSRRRAVGRPGAGVGRPAPESVAPAPESVAAPASPLDEAGPQTGAWRLGPPDGTRSNRRAARRLCFVDGCRLRLRNRSVVHRSDRLGPELSGVAPRSGVQRQRPGRFRKRGDGVRLHGADSVRTRRPSEADPVRRDMPGYSAISLPSHRLNIEGATVSNPETWTRPRIRRGRCDGPRRNVSS